MRGHPGESECTPGRPPVDGRGKPERGVGGGLSALG